VVRAVRQGDIETVFGKETEVEVNAGTHYKYRATIRRVDVAKVLSQEVGYIDYGSFTDTISDPDRKRTYSTVAEALSEYQSLPSSTSPPRPGSPFKSYQWEMFNPMGRLLCTVAGFWRVHRGWPTRFVLPEGAVDAIRRYHLTPPGFRLLQSRLQLVPTPSEGLYVAVDDQARSLAYGASVIEESVCEAEKWFGFK
jgi:hypothetical protein